MSNFNNRGGGGRGALKARRSPPGPDSILHFRFLIPGKAAEIIIGHRGERIQRLMREFNCRLFVSDNRGPERLFLIDSTLDNCTKVWAECFPDLKDIMSSPSRKGGSEMDLRFLCHNSVVGAIIGRGGSKVKDMRTMYQLSLLKVHTDLAPLSTDRVLQIIGPPEKVFECLKILFIDLEEQSIRGPVEHYNPQNFDEKASLSYGGWSSDLGRQFDDGSRSQGHLGRRDGNMNGPHLDHYDGLRKGPSVDQYGESRNMCLSEDSFEKPRNVASVDLCGPRGTNNRDPFAAHRNVTPLFEHYGRSKHDPVVEQFRVSRNQSSISSRDEVPIDQFEGFREGIDYQSEQYDEPRNSSQMDPFRNYRNTGPRQIDQFERSRSTPLMDIYLVSKNAEQVDQCESSSYGTSLDPYRRSRNVHPVDPYGGPRDSEPLLDHYGAVSPMNHFSSERNGGPPEDQYGTGRNAGPAMDHFSGKRNMGPLETYNEKGNETTHFSNGSVNLPSSNQYLGRGATHPPNQYIVSSKGALASRTVVPLMEGMDRQGVYENGGDEFYKLSPNKGSFEDRRPIGGIRRPFPEDRQPTVKKKPRMWDTDNNGNKNNATAEVTETVAGDVDITIPCEFLSVLQGVGGEKLYNIMEDSGANILVKPDEYANGQRVLTLKGTRDEIEGAQYLMQMSITRSTLKL